MTFQDSLLRVFTRHSIGLDRNGPQYLRLCLSLHICLMSSSSARLKFGRLLEQKHSTEHSVRVMGEARKMHREAREERARAKDLQQVQGEQEL